VLHTRNYLFHLFFFYLISFLTPISVTYKEDPKQNIDLKVLLDIFSWRGWGEPHCTHGIFRHVLCAISTCFFSACITLVLFVAREW